MRRRWYDLEASVGGASLAQRVADLLTRARAIVHDRAVTRGAAGAMCGLCHRRDVCSVETEEADDLTLVAGLDRSPRSRIEPLAVTRRELAVLDVDRLRTERGEKAVPGLGMARLERFRNRSLLGVTPGAKPYAREPLDLPLYRREWHLDIEADPTAGPFVYLHGVWERGGRPGAWTERFIAFFAHGEDGERRAFAEVWALLTADEASVI
jgi:predicted RecB family nuclease